MGWFSRKKEVEPYFLIGMTDPDGRELDYLGYKRVKVPVNRVKKTIGDFNTIKLDFDKSGAQFEISQQSYPVPSAGGFIMFGKDGGFVGGLIHDRRIIQLYAYCTVLAKIDINFHDETMMENYIWRD